ncbi:hypothetical protein VXN63_10040 [Marinilactibacillus sp. XAAS-LB27]|uniref:DUF1659 domain-containing protein n=1 Tax=Marinilactibacillus sp. XAAS-LB27 TaxID=3114538 RepID=UPI002E197B06|nr:hypothetical protein [Marinilactibacillus sp. XAAS-LB27]
MQKEWADSKVDIYLEDLENDRLVRQSFNGVVQAPTDEQITEFINAIDMVSDLPAAHGMVVEQYRYSF